MKRNVYLALVFVLIGAILTSSLSTPDVRAAGNQRYVATTGTDSGPCTNSAAPCRSISYALIQAGNGDTIQIASGVYPPNVTLTKSVTLMGAGADMTILDGGGNLAGPSVIMVDNNATVTISRSTIQQGNIGINNLTGTVSVRNSIIKGNFASGPGGGIFNTGTLTLTDSIVTNNGSGTSGANISNAGTLQIHNSTISYGFLGSARAGGGISNNSGSVQISNSTISNNGAGTGGAIATNGGAVTINNSTISSNSSLFGGILEGSFELSNTIVAANDPSSSPCTGPILSRGYNFIDNIKQCNFSATTGDLVGTEAAPIDAKLGPLQDNGSSTPTHALLPGSPALNSGSPSLPSSTIGACTTTDQRGIARPQGVRCDIGAFEAISTSVQAPLEFSKTVSSAQALPGSTVTFTLRVAAQLGPTVINLTDTLPNGLLVVDSSITGGGVLDKGKISFNGPVTPGSPLIISYQARVANPLAPGTVLSNIAVVRAGEQQYIRSAAVTVQDPSFTGTVVLLYANGDNDLASAMVELLNDVEKAAGDTDTVVLAVLDGPDQDDTFLYRLHGDQRTTCPTYSNPTCDGTYVLGRDMWTWGEDLANAEQLAVFIGLGYMYPNARMRVLSLIGHGGGWAPEVMAGQPSRHGGQPDGERLGGMLWDDHPGTTLTTRGLGHALRMATAGKAPLDLLYLDACGMAALEVSYEIADSARYVIAVENWKWAAFPYDAHLAAITPTSTPFELGLSWVQNETTRLDQDALGGNTVFQYPYTYSFIDTSQLSNLHQKVDVLAAELIKIVPSATDRTRVLEAMANTDCFDGNFDGSIVTTPENALGKPFDNVCDLGRLAHQLALKFNANGPLKVAAEQVQMAMLSAVPKSSSRSGVPWKYPNKQWQWTGPYGLSIFVPLHEDNWRRRYYSTLTFAQNNRWDDFLDVWWRNHAPGQPIPVDPPPCQPPGCELPPGPVIQKKIWLPVAKY